MYVYRSVRAACVRYGDAPMASPPTTAITPRNSSGSSIIRGGDLDGLEGAGSSVLMVMVIGLPLPHFVYE